MAENSVLKLKTSLARVATRLGLYSSRPSPAPALLPSTDWRELLADDWSAWEAARQDAVGGPRVLIATSVGGHEGVTPIESLLGVALTLRGAEVHYLLCDQFLPACMLSTMRDGKNHDDFLNEGPAGYLMRALCDFGAT